MKQKAPWMSAIVFSAFSAAVAAAGDYSPGYRSSESPSSNSTANAPTFDQVDRDHNGTIEWFEADQVPGLNLNAADRDSDGMLSVSEYESAVRQQLSGTSDMRGTSKR